MERLGQEKEEEEEKEEERKERPGYRSDVLLSYRMCQKPFVELRVIEHHTQPSGQLVQAVGHGEYLQSVHRCSVRRLFGIVIMCDVVCGFVCCWVYYCVYYWAELLCVLLCVFSSVSGVEGLNNRTITSKNKIRRV